MPSNEITWALWGMAIVAAPTVAVWLWRRLGRRVKVRNSNLLSRNGIDASRSDEHPAYTGGYMASLRSAKALGSKVPESHEVWATRQLEKLGALCHENERRLDALEAKKPKATTPFFMDASSSGTLRYTLHCVDPATSIDEALKRIDAKEPEAGKPKWQPRRVWHTPNELWEWMGEIDAQLVRGHHGSFVCVKHREEDDWQPALRHYSDMDWHRITNDKETMCVWS